MHLGKRRETCLICISCCLCSSCCLSSCCRVCSTLDNASPHLLTRPSPLPHHHHPHPHHHHHHHGHLPHLLPLFLLLNSTTTTTTTMIIFLTCCLCSSSSSPEVAGVIGLLSPPPYPVLKLRTEPDLYLFELYNHKQHVFALELSFIIQFVSSKTH